MPAGCGFAGEVNAALEINTTANQVYQLNFADTKLLQKNIEVSVHDFITSGKNCSVCLESARGSGQKFQPINVLDIFLQ